MTAQIVTGSAELEKLCERIAAAPRVALDTEFHAERTYSAKLMVVQLAFDEGEVIVDPLAVPNLAPLLDALDETLVVGHALAGDVKIFADRFGRIPKRIFDTQIAAAFLGYGMQISLADLVRELQSVRLAKSQTVSDWSHRPLSSEQIEYLVDDVVHLLPMTDALETQLQQRDRSEWARAECAALVDPARYVYDERRAYLRISGAQKMSRRDLAILNEIVKLRDRLARQRDLPPKYILPDDVVAGLAGLRPKREEQLATLRRLEAGARRSLGPAILAAVALGEAVPDEELPARAPRPLGNARDTLASLMAVVMGELAVDLDLPSGLLAPRSALDRIARELPRDREALAACLDLAPWRVALLVEPFWRLLSGEAGLNIEGYAQGNPKIRISS